MLRGAQHIILECLPYEEIDRVKPVYQQMTLSPGLGAAGMIILIHGNIRSPLLTLIFISVAFSPRPLGIGIQFQILLSPLLKVPRMVLLSSLVRARD